MIARIISDLVKSLPIPVTAKIRLGWDSATRNYLEVARIIEDNGGALIAVHGRTRDQAYAGNADWDAIAEIKQAVSIPVIANGDVRTVEDIRLIKEHTGCDGVMIGRAAMANPWIFSRLDRSQVSVIQLRATIKDHLQRMIEFYGVEAGILRFRKHILHYLAVYILPSDRRLALLACMEPQGFLEMVDKLIDTSPLKIPL